MDGLPRLGSARPMLSPLPISPPPRTLRALLLIAAPAAAASLAGACGPTADARCDANAWAGQCQLTALNRVREAEFPVPYVVYEAIYTPQPNSYSNITPGPLRVEVQAGSTHEAAVRSHFEQYATVACQEHERAPGTCVPGPVVVQVPPFDPNRYAVQEQQIRGCAQIEDQSTQDRLRELGYGSGQELGSPLPFAQGSATLSGDALTHIEAWAAQLAADPRLECVAIVGEISREEPLPLAEERARQVKQALVARGVDAARLVTIATSVPMSATGEVDRTPDPSLRRVRLRALLRSQ